MVLIRRGTLLAVLLLLSSNLFVADVKGDDVSLSSHRQLKSGRKNSKDRPTGRPTGRPTTENPTATPLPPFFTTSYRLVGIARGTSIDATTTVGVPPNQQSVSSFVGTTAIVTLDIFPPENVFLDEDDNFLATKGDPIGTYTRTSQIDSGTFPSTATQSSSVSVCFSIPFFGGCILLHTGGEFQFKILDPNRLPDLTFVSSGANTGVQFFGVEYFAFQQLISTVSSDPNVPNSGIEVLQFDITQIIPKNACDIFDRNVKLGEEVPGFIPKEGEIRVDEVSRPRTRYTFFTEENCGNVL